MDMLVTPDLDDVGYEWYREAQLEALDSLPGHIHWRYSPAELYPACGRGPAQPVVTSDPVAVSCRACRRSGPYREAS